MELGPTIPFAPNSRSPEPAFEILHADGAALRLFSAKVEQLFSGAQWAEGPVWFGDQRSLIWSDIPMNRMLRWDEATGHVGVFRSPSNNSNGLARDRSGRLLACEHLTRRVTRTEYDGSITVLADSFDGKPLNSPNDITTDAAGNVWFTDPPFGIHGDWEGAPATPQLPHGVYRVDAASGRVEMVIDDLQGSNGLAFSPDGRVLYVIESRATPHRLIWAWDHEAGRLSNRRRVVDAGGPGALDGMAVDVRGNLWCGFGSNGEAGVDAAALDGVRIYAPDGRAIAHIHLPERCANLCFGGTRMNRVFMASTHSLYALYVNVRGAV
ncbi:MAG: SMP-30/gluconolactonase/LRE family protein [Paucibacter sp.]|nr:SMP-30/gluconolactonase/LRE family protein [Roseateles sp.]